MTPRSRGAAFLKTLRERYEGMGLDEEELALQAAALIDLCDELGAIVVEEGTIVHANGRPAVHPAQVERRHARDQLRKTLKALNLPAADDSEPGLAPLRGKRKRSA